MKRLGLHLCFHHHQPVGNIDWVLEEVYQNAYAPLLEAMTSVPHVRLNLSYSAPVLRFIEKNHPEYLEKLRELNHQGRVELLVTGFYEPVLADLAPEDRLGQLELCRRWLEERFGVQPRGSWLSEGVWDKHLIESFRAAGLNYTLLPDQRFIHAGVSPADLHHYFITEEQGKTLALFPASVELLYRIPYGSSEELHSLLRRRANRGPTRLTFADVAERWGAWPGTAHLLHREGAMERLISFFSGADDWLQFQLFSETLEDCPPVQPCYLPSGPNHELGAWSLPDEARVRFYEARSELERRHDAARFLPFFGAGCWESFKGKYPEANLMQKKGLWLKAKLRQREREHLDPVSRDWLFQAQCNTAYWHGTSGGIYSPHLRQAVWDRLLATQRRLGLKNRNFGVERFDFEGRGHDAVLVYSPKISLGWSPDRGGTCFEWSALNPLYNYANTLSRRHESAPRHEPHSVVQSDDDERLVDPYSRRLFHDHFLGTKVTVEQFLTNRIRERGDFINRRFRIVSLQNQTQGPELTMEATGSVEQGGLFQAVRLRKRVEHRDLGRCIALAVQLTNEGKDPLDGIYALETNVSLAPQQESVHYRAGEHPVRLLRSGAYAQRIKQAQFFTSGDKQCFRVRSRDAFFLWAAPLATRNQQDVGSQAITQGHLIVVGWSFHVEPGEDCAFAAEWTVSDGFHKMID